MTHVVQEILRLSVEEAQIENLVQVAGQFLDRMLQAADAEVRMLNHLLQRGRTTLVSAETTRNPANDAKSPASRRQSLVRPCEAESHGGPRKRTL